MNRKLRNSLTALTTCSVALVLALVGVSPLIRAGDRVTKLNVTVDHAGVDTLALIGTTLTAAPAPCAEASPCSAQAAELPATAPAAPLIQNIKSATDAATTTSSRSRRDNRQPLVMPYFSFAPRG
ncbi:hypothetical protein [Marilutibacter chinensis]|uniref:Uncharacterized protein n=1 Tax=Marilutibacter chinensis TaxID=2912247 RepID=A0ABS9HPT8_9GAMM|nr:hypothetical protein [Lysobacter chinensis]MCF7220249.1 hypothetical protein [Lysobacter chinensis]